MLVVFSLIRLMKSQEGEWNLSTWMGMFKHAKGGMARGWRRMALGWAYTRYFVLDWMGGAMLEVALFDRNRHSSRKIRTSISAISHLG